MIKLDSFSLFFVANWKLNGNFKFIDQFIAVDVIKNIDENHSATKEAKKFADKKGLKWDNDKKSFKDA